MWLHWATNRFLDRLAMAFIVNSESGTVMNETTASSGEMTTIMMSTPMSDSMPVSIWLSVCCRLWATLSMSLVTRLSRSPRGWPAT